VKLLVIGARDFSLGWHVAEIAKAEEVEVITAGIEGEQYRFDARQDFPVAPQMMREIRPDSVVCTVGINYPGPFMGHRSIVSLQEHLNVNTLGPVKVLRAWLDFWIHGHGMRPNDPFIEFRHFVVISSNSATIARTSSTAYCTSKAALSMAVRCISREMTMQEYPVNIYGYEPGWMTGTPMSVEVEAKFRSKSKRTAMHRIPGGKRREIQPQELARIIIRNLMQYISPFNGQMIRVDSGEE
jgi:NAD(P)-dependent dehydrogenase (short-subunit alcohol dehydrogenase family)